MPAKSRLARSRKQPDAKTKPLVESNQQVAEPAWFTELYLPKLRPIFKEAIESNSLHDSKRLSAILTAIQQNSDREEFWQALVECANYGLTSSPKLAAGTAIIDLLAKTALLQLNDAAQASSVAKTTASVAEPGTSAQTSASAASATAASATINEELTEGQDLDDPDCLAGRLINHCMDLSCTADKAVRMRSVQLMYKILSGLPISVQINDDTFDRIRHCLLERAWDVCGPVRAESLRALNRLQMPARRDCPVVSLITHVAKFDPSAEVRRTAVQSLAFSTRTTPAIVSRTRDVDESVRRAAYDKLAERTSVFYKLDIQCRVTLLSSGLSDSATSVVTAAKRLASRLLQNFNNSFIELLRFFDVALSGEHCTQILSILMPDQLPSIIEEVAACLDDRRLLRPDCVTSEASFLWLRLVRLLESRKEIEPLAERLLPGGLDFQRMLGDVLNRQVTSVELVHDWIFLARQLLQLCSSLDLSDEFTHESLLRHAQEALKTAPLDLVEDLLQLRKRLFGRREADFSNSGIELITDIRDAARDAAELPDCNEEATPEDEATLERCNLIAWKLLWLCDSRRLSPAQRSLVETLVLPSIKHTGHAVRQYAVSALSIACGRDRGLALTHVPLLMEIAKLDVPLVRVAALGGMFDCFLVFGMDTFVTAATSGVRTNRSELETDFLQLIGGSADDLFATKLPSQQSLAASSAVSVPSTPAGATAAESTITTSEVVSSLLAYPISQLDSELPIIRTICVEGLSRLLLFGHVNAPKLVSRLLLLWYNPATLGDHRLRECLSQFFPAYSFTKPEYQLAVAKSAVYSLHTLFKAPPNSRLYEVDHNRVAEMLVLLTDAKNLRDNKALDEAALASLHQPAHEEFGLSLANEIARSPNGAGVALLVRTLGLLQMGPACMRRVLDILLPCLANVREHHHFQAVSKYTNAVAAHLGVNLLPGSDQLPAALTAVRNDLNNQQQNVIAANDLDEDDDDEDSTLLPDDLQGNPTAGFIGQLHSDSYRKRRAGSDGAAAAQVLNSTLAPGGEPAPTHSPRPQPAATTSGGGSEFRTPAGRPPQSAAKAKATAAASNRKRASTSSRVSVKSNKKQPRQKQKALEKDDGANSEDSMNSSFLGGASAAKKQRQKSTSDQDVNDDTVDSSTSTKATNQQRSSARRQSRAASPTTAPSASSITAAGRTRRRQSVVNDSADVGVGSAAAKPPLPPTTTGARPARLRQRVASSTLNSEESFSRVSADRLDDTVDDENSIESAAATPRPTSARKQRSDLGETSRRSSRSSRSRAP